MYLLIFFFFLSYMLKSHYLNSFHCAANRVSSCKVIGIVDAMEIWSWVKYLLDLGIDEPWNVGLERPDYSTPICLLGSQSSDNYIAASIWMWGFLSSVLHCHAVLSTSFCNPRTYLYIIFRTCTCWFVGFFFLIWRIVCFSDSRTSLSRRSS